MTRVRLLVALAVVVVVAVLAALLTAVFGGSARQTTFTARFSSAPGLYAGNQVDILGMPVGKVLRVTPHPTYVTVEMQVPASQPVPADVKALIEAPNVVNDRYVLLSPVYRGGPRLATGTLIPPDRTAVPISTDAITDSLDQLARALGPAGANRHGALGRLFASLSKTLGGTGPALHSTVTSLGGALGALSSKGPDLTALLDGLGNLTRVASQYTSTYRSFAANLASVSTSLADDDPALSQALASLQQLLANLTTFIRDNYTALGGSVHNLASFAAAVGEKQQQLAQVFSALPVALQNVDNAFDPTGPGGASLRARLDLMSGSSDFTSAVCGNSLLRLLLLAFAPKQDPLPNLDLACGVGGLFQSLPTPPGASTGPDLSLGALVGGDR